jgi:hypothetical protein
MFSDPRNEPEITSARDKLHISLEKLQGSLETIRLLTHAQAKLKDEKQLDSSSKEPLASQPEELGDLVHRVLALQDKQQGTIPGIVQSWLAKICPLATLVLGTLSFSADVSFSFPFKTLYLT